MIAVIRLVRRPRHLAVLAAAALALLVTSCAWGVVTDSQTGQAVPGAQITFHDSEGKSGTTSAKQDGLYAFDIQKGPIPAKGMVTYEVTAPGYEPLTVQREVGYDDNTAGTWEIQDFALQPEAGRYHNEEAGFSIEFPQDWLVMDNFYGEGSVSADAPFWGPDAPAGVSVLSEELPRGMSLEGWWELTLVMVRGEVTDYREHERGETTIDNVDATWVVISYTISVGFEGWEVEVTEKDLVYVFKKGRDAYMIVCYTTSDQFRRLRSQFEEIVQSFRFE